MIYLELEPMMYKAKDLLSENVKNIVSTDTRRIQG